MRIYIEALLISAPLFIRPTLPFGLSPSKPRPIVMGRVGCGERNPDLSSPLRYPSSDLACVAFAGVVTYNNFSNVYKRSRVGVGGDN